MGELRLRSAGWRLCAVAAVFAGVATTAPVQARVTRIVIDATADIAGQPGYEQVTGRAFGELDPANVHNRLITDITNPLARDASGKVTYVASFQLRKPKDMTTASGVMWHDVPNRGGNVAFPADSFAANDVQLLSAFLVDLHLGTRRPMMAAFLDAVGVKHEGGRIDTEASGPIEVSPERLRTAADDLATRYPLDEVVSYFLTLLLQDAETWGAGAMGWLESLGA